jgi:hypothetical protein
MAIYLCRWPNGDFSIVNATTKTEAIELLDEWGNAERATISRMTDCMFDFKLGDDGHFELVDVGECTRDGVIERCYPELNKALAAVEWDEGEENYSAEGYRQIRAAVELERTRLLENPPPPKEAETGIGREIQNQTDAPSVVVNRIVREAASKRLKTKEGEGKKPN